MVGTSCAVDLTQQRSGGYASEGEANIQTIGSDGARGRRGNSVRDADDSDGA